MTEQGWLRVLIEQMQGDMTEMKADIKQLLEEKAETRGKQYVLIGMISFGINILAVVAEIYLRGK